MEVVVPQRELPVATLDAGAAPDEQPRALPFEHRAPLAATMFLSGIPLPANPLLVQASIPAGLGA